MAQPAICDRPRIMIGSSAALVSSVLFGVGVRFCSSEMHAGCIQAFTWATYCPSERAS